MIRQLPRESPLFILVLMDRSRKVCLMGHGVIDRRSLALNRLVADKIRQQPALMSFVRSNLREALSDPVLSESAKDSLREWEQLFRTRSLAEVLNILVEDSDEGQRLRQSTPFWGVLTPRERLSVFSRSHEPSGA